MILSHYLAGTGAVLVETREEQRLLVSILDELPKGAPVARVAAPGGPLRAVCGEIENAGQGLAAGYQWAAGGPGRVLVVYDWHVLVNSPGHWRALIESLPELRQPKGARGKDPASLVVFVGPDWDLSPANPLRGAIPILQFAPPNRKQVRKIAEDLAPINGESEAIIDALTGLAGDVADQAAAECLAAKGDWDVDYLRESRRRLIREAGLEIWPAVATMGGLGGIKTFAEKQVIPWLRDPQLSVRRILCAGVPGVGKSYCARWLAYRLGCECARLSIPSLKAGIVGSSEANLRRALAVIDALAKDAPLVVVLDEIDTLAREGLDGGTSSGMFAELLTWLQESTAQAVVIATLNRLDKLDAAMESRFHARFFFELPTEKEREAVAALHFGRLGCATQDNASAALSEVTEGFSSREIAESLVPDVARETNRKPTPDVIRRMAKDITPSSVTQAEQLKNMRAAAASLRRANDPEAATARPTGRRIGGVK